MLTTLRIAGLAVVDRIEVRFGPGLNVLTGETGAGKSILVSALHLVLGGRAGAEVVREGVEEASVEALFELPAGHPVFARLSAAGLAHGDERGPSELLVRRVVSRSGRGRAFVNGALCTVGMLAEAMRGVVDLSGQHEHLALLDEGGHLDLLDGFGGVSASEYRELHAALAARLRERRELEEGEAERARRADYLAYQLRELEEADPRPGEDAALEAERKVLAASERLSEAARTAEAVAYGEEGSASERLAQALRAMQEAAALDVRLREPVALLRAAAAEVEEAGRQLARYAESVGGDPERLQVVEDRLELLRSLARKGGGSLEAALARRESMRAEVATIGGSGERLGEVERELAALGPRVVQAANALTEQRRGGARAFAAAVARELARLSMKRCEVAIELTPPPEAVSWAGVALGPDGAEGARILIAPNPGEPARPLAKIASGGELSRLLLAVKRALAAVDPVPTYVFDEVDSGIGGAVAESVGRVLAEVAAGRQVLCVTHLPQVAAFGARHHRVEKRVSGGRTSTAVELLEANDERQREIGRMLAGATVTASALDHAAALLAAAHPPGAYVERGTKSAPVLASRPSWRGHRASSSKRTGRATSAESGTGTRTRT